MNEINYSTLRELGFDKPENVWVYGYGGVRLIDNSFSSDNPDDIPYTPTLHTDNKIIFYGESDVRNNIGDTETSISINRNAYSRAGYYFLSDKAPTGDSNISVSPYNTQAELSREYHTALIVDEEEAECPAMGGTEFFGSDLTKYTDYSRTFVTDKPYSAKATMRFEFAAKSSATVFLSLQYPSDVTVTTNSSARAESIQEDSHYYYMRGSGTNTFSLRSGSDQTYKIVPSLKSSADIEYAALNYMGLIYLRNNDITDKSQIRMTFFKATGNSSFRITGVTAHTQAWDVTDPLNIYSYELHLNGDTADATFSTGGTSYVEVFDPSSQLYTPEIVGTITHQNLHALSVPDMLIVTTKALKAYAEELAEIHRTFQGMTVHVVEQEQAFNEFSSGTPHPMGIRRLAKMFYDRNPKKFRYLLLYGGGSYDNRAILLPTENYLLTYQCENKAYMNNASTSYCSDAYFGMLSDDYNNQKIYFENMSIAVGRIPALQTGDAVNANKKIRYYFENPPIAPVTNRVLLLADVGDSKAHLNQIEAIADTIQKYSTGTTITKAYNSLYPLTDNGTNAKAARQAITNALSAGVKYMAYCGHGNALYITTEKTYQTSDIQANSYSFFPIVMMATCDIFSFDRTNTDMGSAFIYKSDGGSSAIIAAGRTVYLTYNQYLATAVAREVSTATSSTNTGDIFRNAHNYVANDSKNRSNSSMGINSLCYNFGGDPALPLYAPSYNIDITGLSNTTNVTPLKPINIEGQILNDNGLIASTYNGTVSIAVYGAPRTVSTYARRNDSSTNIKLDEDLIAEYSTKVTSGKFNLSMILPEPERATSSIRISAYAISDDATTAIGSISNIRLSSSTTVADNTTDTEAPVIEQIYLNSPEFNDGDCVGSTPVFYAVIAPDKSGIKVSTSGLGGIHLTLDNSSSFPEIVKRITTDADGTATISLPISQLPDGRHTLSLSVTDNVGNISQGTISFIVRSENDATLTVDEYPINDTATIRLTHSFSEVPEGKLIIEDANGNSVYINDNPSFPFNWDLCHQDGTQVANGEYFVYAILKAGKEYGSTDRLSIVVIK